MSLHHDEQTDILFKSILSLTSVEECYRYFEDLCTNKEVRDMGQRLQIAIQITQKKSYLEAAESLGVSSATIGRVKRCVDYGSGGYAMINDRLKENKE